MGKKTKRVYELMSQLNQVGRNGITGYETSKIYKITNEAIEIISSLKKIDENLRSEIINQLNDVISDINTKETDLMGLIRKANSPLISTLNFYGIEFY